MPQLFPNNRSSTKILGPGWNKASDTMSSFQHISKNKLQNEISLAA